MTFPMLGSIKVKSHPDGIKRAASFVEFSTCIFGTGMGMLMLTAVLQAIVVGSLAHTSGGKFIIGT